MSQDHVSAWVEAFTAGRRDAQRRLRWIGMLEDAQKRKFAMRWRTGEVAKARIARGEMWYQRDGVHVVECDLHFSMEDFVEAMNGVQAHIESALGLPPEAVRP